MPVTIKCEFCGKERQVWPCKAGMRYCSISCSAAARKKPVAERFWKYVEKGEGCWIWKGSATKRGYGQINYGSHARGMSTTHRVAWALTYGPIPEGKYVLHKCDNRRCVRPDHLFLGTHLENIQDMIQKGRNAKGEASGTAKLLERQVVEILERWDKGEKHRDIATMFKISPQRISDLVHGRGWQALTIGKLGGRPSR